MKDSASLLLYQETMRGLPRWLGLAVFAAGVAAAVALLVSARGQTADPIFWLAALPATAALIVAPLALALWELDVKVHPDRLVIRLRPLTARTIALTAIQSCEPRTYRPIIEYLGWGWRWGPTGSALTVPGRRGVQLVLRGGERLLISSARPEEMAAAIRSAPLSKERP